jgi:hypothetical protein
MVITGGRTEDGLSQDEFPQIADHNVPAGTMAMARSREALRCSKEQNALHTLICQRHPTPSCGEFSLYRGKNHEPGKGGNESLTSDPELKNSLAS